MDDQNKMNSNDSFEPGHSVLQSIFQIDSAPKILMVAGAVLFFAGLVWYFLAPFFKLGKLPGDFSYEGEKIKVYFPLASSIILSVVLSLVFALVGKIFK